MSLRETIKNLKNIAQRLDAATFNLEMSTLKNFADELGDKIFSVKPSEDLLQKTLDKFLRGDFDFTRRELRTLPFIIFDNAITFDDTKKILNMLDLKDKRHLSGLVNVYLNNYGSSNKTELLRHRINFIPKEFAEGSTRLEKIFASKENLFGDNCMANMTKFFAQKLSVGGVLEEVGLTDFYKASNFIQAALIIFFRSNAAPLPDKFKILDELNTEFETYKNIFPYIADVLIQSVVRDGFGKRKCTEIFYHRLGDPRFGEKRFNWDNVSQKSKDIFSQWLSEEDLETFFELIRETAVDRMWRYREKFWRAYLPYIIKTKIFLGKDAKNLAVRMKDQVKLNHGTLTGAADNQSVFVFQIGRFIFSEWSHNGKLRIHEVKSTLNLFETAENFFERNFIGRDTLIRNSNAEWIHSSPKTYSWQGKVSEWLKVNCGISKTQHEWGLEN